MPNKVYKTKKKQTQKNPLPSVKDLYPKAQIDNGDARQRQKRIVSGQKASTGIAPGTYTRATQNGPAVYNKTLLNDEGIEIPDPRYGLIMQGEYVQGLRGPYKDLGHDVQVGVPMIMEVIPGTGLFPKSKTIVNYQGDPGYLNAQNRLAEAYNRNGGNIKIGDEEKPYLLPEVQILYRKNGGTMKKLISKHQHGNPIEKQDNTNVKQKKKRNLTKEQYSYYNSLINKAFPTTFEKIKQDLVNRSILPGENNYSVPVGYLGDGYRSVTVLPEVKYGPYDLPEMTVDGWGVTPDPEYSDDQWKKLAEKTVQNDTTLSQTDASKYMWALDHPEFHINPFMRYSSIPVQPGPWTRELRTSVDYEGYLPSDSPKYGGHGDVVYSEYQQPRVTTYKTTKYPPKDYNNKEHLYYWLDRFYNRKNGITSLTNPFMLFPKGLNLTTIN